MACSHPRLGQETDPAAAAAVFQFAHGAAPAVSRHAPSAPRPSLLRRVAGHARAPEGKLGICAAPTGLHAYRRRYRRQSRAQSPSRWKTAKTFPRGLAKETGQ